MSAERPGIAGHRGGIDRPRIPLDYDPSRLSPAAVKRIIDAAGVLCASVEGLDAVPGLDQPTAARILREPLSIMQSELAAVGLIAPRDQVRN